MVLGHSRYRPKGCSEGCAKWRVRGLGWDHASEWPQRHIANK